MFYKTEKLKCFAYLAHTDCDDNNFILGFDITTGNIHDSVSSEDVYSKVIDRYGSRVISTAIDAIYVTPHIAKTLLESKANQKIFTKHIWQKYLMKQII